MAIMGGGAGDFNRTEVALALLFLALLETEIYTHKKNT